MKVSDTNHGFELAKAKPVTPNRKLVWCDLETTGLPELSKGHVFNHMILEAAFVVTDQKLNIIDKMNIIMHVDMHVSRALSDDIVWKMHINNGLFEESNQSDIGRAEAEEKILEFLINSGVEQGSSPLCGSSVHMDRFFIEAKMPKLNKFLHYRNIDVSSIKELIFDFGQSHDLGKKNAHRAMDDILHSILQARQYRSLLNAGVALFNANRE